MKRLIDSLGAQCNRMLTIQYRMNTVICEWVSGQLYDSKLKAHESVTGHLLADLSGVEATTNTSSPLVFIDTDGCDLRESVGEEDEESKANEGEANIACRHVEELIAAGLKQECIGVITPYNLQMELIKAKLNTKYSQVKVKKKT